MLTPDKLTTTLEEVDLAFSRAIPNDGTQQRQLAIMGYVRLAFLALISIAGELHNTGAKLDGLTRELHDMSTKPGGLAK